MSPADQLKGMARGSPYVRLPDDTTITYMMMLMLRMVFSLSLAEISKYILALT